eukprot:TRINITY_DN8146_c0_g1_i1.p1 TRINITY_DN8146_c0_g1~~TRINITY_DN8146_c0_g1_i1.p1  ORF type:complete len:187 (-),score=34.94 TRINITY_DN8146_c0_g1_i1:15-575(-)
MFPMDMEHQNEFKTSSDDNFPAVETKSRSRRRSKEDSHLNTIASLITADAEKVVISFKDEAKTSKDNDVQLSLCGGLIFKDEDNSFKKCEEIFQAHRITFEKFCEQTELMFNPELVLKVNKRIYPWTVAGPLVVSKLVYGKSLPPTTIAKLIEDFKKKLTKKRGGWFSFWRRGASPQTTPKREKKK